MQEIFKTDQKARSEFIALLSRERFARYMQAADQDEAKAVALYCWNMRISQSLYPYLQSWEIALRNRLNAFLSWKYNSHWPYDEQRCIRNLAKDDRYRLADTKQRKERDHKSKPVATPIIVADLSAGFWVSQLSKPYLAQYGWKYNLARIFPHDKSIDQQTAWQKCDGILKLRNRVAHHEPIHRLPLQDLYQDLQLLVGGMCPATRQFAEASCNFRQTWELWHKPRAPVPPAPNEEQ